MSGSVSRTGLRLFRDGEQGMTLIETLVALGIIAAVAVVFLIGMTTSAKAVMISQERVAVDSLAKSQMEDTKAQLYIKIAEYPNKSYTLITVPTDLKAQGYAVTVDTPQNVINPLVTGSENIQKITVHITRTGDPLLNVAVVGYKVNR